MKRDVDIPSIQGLEHFDVFDNLDFIKIKESIYVKMRIWVPNDKTMQSMHEGLEEMVNG